MTDIKHRRMKSSLADRGFYVFNGITMAVIFVLFAWPLWFILVASVSDPNLVQAGEVWLWPRGFHLGGYELLAEYGSLLRGYTNSIAYTVTGTALNIVMTICAAYPLSRMDFMPRKILTIFCIITIFFSGGLIPYFLQVRSLGLYNSPLVFVIPSAIAVMNVLLLRSFFMYGIPKEIEEAAVIDGANSFQLLLNVLLPLARPILAVLVLFNAVGRWNDYFTPLIFITDPNLVPLQIVLRDILIVGNVDLTTTGMEMEAIMRKLRIAQTLKYSVIVVSTLPLMLLYPFIQKHFVKGVMLGAIKG